MYVFQFRVSIDEIVWVVGGAKLLPVRALTLVFLKFLSIGSKKPTFAHLAKTLLY